MDPLASCPPAVQPVDEVRQSECDEGSNGQDVPHIGHQGNPDTHQGQRDKHRISDPKREMRLVHSRSIRPNQPSTPPPAVRHPTVPATTPKRRIPEIVHRPPSITSSIELLLSDVAASQKVLNTPARRVKRDQLDRATIKLLWPHIHELYTEARPRMGLPERPTTVRTMTPAECAERVLGWPHTGVQVINGLTAKAQAGT